MSRNMRNRLFFTLLLFLFVALYSAAIFAATGSGYDASKLKAPTNLGSDLNTAGQSWWDALSYLGMWACGIGGALMYMAGKTEWVRWAIVGLIIFAFGDLFANFILGLGSSPGAA